MRYFSQKRQYSYNLVLSGTELTSLSSVVTTVKRLFKARPVGRRTAVQFTYLWSEPIGAACPQSPWFPWVTWNCKNGRSKSTINSWQSSPTRRRYRNRRELRTKKRLYCYVTSCVAILQFHSTLVHFIYYQWHCGVNVTIKSVSTWYGVHFVKCHKIKRRDIKFNHNILMKSKRTRNVKIVFVVVYAKMLNIIDDKWRKMMVEFYKNYPFDVIYCKLRIFSC